MDTLGIVEVKTIAGGVELADRMMKTAEVELMRASTICSGRYLIFVSGERSAVASAITTARESDRQLTGSFIISNVSPELIRVLKQDGIPGENKAIGVVECRTVAAGVAAADSAVKRSDIQLLRLVTGQGINGKSYFILNGDVASVEEATATAASVLGKNLLEAVVIPRPDASVVRSLVRGVR